MATVATTPKGSELPPRGGWKNRFMGRGKSKERRRNSTGAPKESKANEMTRSLSAKRNQRANKKGGGIIRKLKGSFRKERTLNVNTEEPFASVLNNDSDTSPSNPQSPFSTDSFVTVEVRKILMLDLVAYHLQCRSFSLFHLFFICYSL